jgi:hypothetical protein
MEGISKETMSYIEMVYVQGHAKVNAIDAVCIEKTGEKYGNDDLILMIWDFDADIVENAERLIDEIYTNPEKYFSKRLS